MGRIPLDRCRQRLGMPALSENRTVTGVDGPAACAFARVSVAAGRGSESAGIHQALGMCRPKAGVYAAGQFVEDFKYVGDEFGWHILGLDGLS